MATQPHKHEIKINKLLGMEITLDNAKLVNSECRNMIDFLKDLIAAFDKLVECGVAIHESTETLIDIYEEQIMELQMTQVACANEMGLGNHYHIFA